MKSIMTLLLFVGFVSSGQSQQMISMDELTINEGPALSLKVNPTTSASRFIIRERYAGQFRSNPLDFVNANFDIHRFIEENRDSGNVSYLISFSSNSGFINVRFDKKGKILSTRKEIKDVPIALENFEGPFKKYGEWKIVKSKHVETHVRGKLVQNFYKVKVTDGKKTKILKFNRINSTTGQIVSK